MGSDTYSHIYPVKTLTKIVSEPTFATLFQLQKELQMNSRSVPSTRGGGMHGHLSLVLPAAAYLVKAGHAFDPPVHPGVAPAHDPTLTALENAAIDRAHDVALKEITIYARTELALKQQIWEAVDEEHYKHLSNGMDGYADVSVLAILIHLWSEYGQITATAKVANMAKLKNDFDSSQPISTLWNHIAAIQDFAQAANMPIAADIIVSETLEVLERTGIYCQPVRNFKGQHPDTTWTVALLKQEFNRIYKTKAFDVSAKSAGYHGANAIAPKTTVDSKYIPTNEFACEIFYCHSHGIGTNPKHTSMTCTNKGPNHEDKATFQNRMGGVCYVIGSNRTNKRNTAEKSTTEKKN